MFAAVSERQALTESCKTVHDIPHLFWQMNLPTVAYDNEIREPSLSKAQGSA